MTTENQYLNDWNYLYTPENDWDDFDETMSTEIANSQNHPIFYDLSNEDKFDEQRRLAKARRYWHTQTSNVDNKYYKPGRKAVEKPKEDKVEMLSNGKVVPPLNWENPTYTNWALDNGASASNLSPTELFYKKNDQEFVFLLKPIGFFQKGIFLVRFISKKTIRESLNNQKMWKT